MKKREFKLEKVTLAEDEIDAEVERGIQDMNGPMWHAIHSFKF